MTVPRSTAFDRWLANLRHRQAARHLRAGLRLCDVGCGSDALFLRHVARLGGFQVGLDQQPVVTHPVGAAIVRADIAHPLPFRDTSFEHVTMLAVIEHLPQPELALREAHRILVSGGTLILTWPSALVDPMLVVLRRVGLVSGEMRADQHQPRRSHRAWSAMLERMGFRNPTHRAFELGLNHVMVAEKSEQGR